VTSVKATKQRGTRFWVALLFLGPAMVVLLALVVWPAIRTVYDSFYDAAGRNFVGFQNYVDMFRFERMRTAIRNSFIWVIVFPVLVTTTGLVLAVLSERVRWRTAFRLILFMPAAIAILSSGIIWRIMYETDPSRGAINALLNVPAAIINPPGNLQGTAPSTDDVILDDGGLSTTVEIGADGGVVRLGLLRIRVEDLPESSIQAADPVAAGGGTLSGVVWRDTRSGDNQRGVVEDGEIGVPAVTVQVVDSAGNIVGSAGSGDDGRFLIDGLDPGTYSAVVPPAEFQGSWGGISWLGPTLITIAAIVAGIWIWGGFALLVIASGLAALPRELQEAARVDGATEFQVFRRITLPLLTPVLGVVFVALTINALKMFDLIVGIAPGSVQDEANVIALEMWRTAFTGLGNRGLGSAIAVFLFVLILPVMLLNIRRFKLDEDRR
jgi:alpha-glucoside transport system permease protein